MTTTANHAGSAADAQGGTAQGQQTAQQPNEPELKSTDTGVLSQLRAAQAHLTGRPDTATPAPQATQTADAPADGGKPEGEKPDSNAAPADEQGKPDATASEAEHQGDDEQDDRDDRDRKLEPWMRKRLSRAEERGRRQALAEFTALLRQLQPQTAQAISQQYVAGESVQPDAQPKTLADFDNDIEAYTDYLVEQKLKKALTERERQEELRRQQQAAEEARRAFEARRAKFEAEFGPGAWDEVITAPVDIPQQVVDLLKGHPRDLWIARHLVQHPAELDQLRGKSALEIAQRLAEIDARLQGANSQRRELPPKVTKTPPPPPELPSGTSTVKSIDDMTTEERIAEWRRQRQAARR